MSRPVSYTHLEFEVVDVNIDTQSRDGVYPSDHYPVMATLRFKDMA